MALLSLIIVLLTVVGFILMIIGTLRKNKWGINAAALAKPQPCTQCGTPCPRIRKPQNITEALWGGWACSNCGLQLDKWGRVRASK